MYDLTPSRNSDLKTLPLPTSGNVSVELRFGQDVANDLRCIFVGNFRNQFHLGYKTEIRRNYDY